MLEFDLNILEAARDDAYRVVVSGQEQTAQHIERC
jgi:hypothetical protein